MNKKNKNIIIILVIAIGIGLFIFFGKIAYDLVKYNQRISEVMADDKEIERKWLIDKEKIPYDLNDISVQVFDIKQTYLNFEPELRLRDINNGQAYTFTIKSNMSEDGLVRDEVNFDITKDEYDNLIKKMEGITIHKTRYQLLDKDIGEIIAIDIFHEELDGLAYMEIEFASEEESNKFADPDWIIKDVTSDINYKNGYLARFGIPD